VTALANTLADTTQSSVLHRVLLSRRRRAAVGQPNTAGLENETRLCVVSARAQESVLARDCRRCPATAWRGGRRCRAPVENRRMILTTVFEDITEGGAKRSLSERCRSRPTFRVALSACEAGGSGCAWGTFDCPSIVHSPTRNILGVDHALPSPEVMPHGTSVDAGVIFSRCALLRARRCRPPHWRTPEGAAAAASAQTSRISARRDSLAARPARARARQSLASTRGSGRSGDRSSTTHLGP
jgi:hypothetical protein